MSNDTAKLVRALRRRATRLFQQPTPVPEAPAEVHILYEASLEIADEFSALANELEAKETDSEA